MAFNTIHNIINQLTPFCRASASTGPFGLVPQELLDVVIFHLADDRSTLLSCALVHSTWNSISRYHLRPLIPVVSSSSSRATELTELMELLRPSCETLSSSITGITLQAAPPSQSEAPYALLGDSRERSFARLEPGAIFPRSHRPQSDRTPYLDIMSFMRALSGSFPRLAELTIELGAVGLNLPDISLFGLHNLRLAMPCLRTLRVVGWNNDLVRWLGDNIVGMLERLDLENASVWSTCRIEEAIPLLQRNKETLQDLRLCFLKSNVAFDLSNLLRLETLEVTSTVGDIEMAWQLPRSLKRVYLRDAFCEPIGPEAMYTMAFNTIQNILTKHAHTRRSSACTGSFGLVPQELLDLVIFFLTDDQATLLSCALVHPTWTSISRYHLPPLSLVISPSRVKELIKLLRSSRETLSSSITGITLVGDIPFDDMLANSKSPRARSYSKLLHVLKAKNIMLRSVVENEPPLVGLFAQYFSDLVRLKVICASYQELTSFMRALSGSFPRLAELSIELGSGGMDIPDASLTGLRGAVPCLRTLRVVGWNNDLMRWLGDYVVGTLERLDLESGSVWSTCRVEAVILLLHRNKETLQDVRLYFVKRDGLGVRFIEFIAFGSFRAYGWDRGYGDSVEWVAAAEVLEEGIFTGEWYENLDTETSIEGEDLTRRIKSFSILSRSDILLMTLNIEVHSWNTSCVLQVARRILRLFLLTSQLRMELETKVVTFAAGR
ncbi:hypothetical protein BDZ89DRAFT_1163125 [Hymenopellis radicata]|nr:hypothetical protein BDZ89DRAFT_1163125 [Hymenopellis radicata]